MSPRPLFFRVGASICATRPLLASPEKPAWNSASARFVYDSVDCFVTTWDKGARHEARVGGSDEFRAAGFLGDPVEGKVRACAWFGRGRRGQTNRRLEK